MKDVSFQLYSARNFPPFADVLKAIGEAGYSQVEGYGALYAALSDAEIASFKHGLDENGLAMPRTKDTDLHLISVRCLPCQFIPHRARGFGLRPLVRRPSMLPVERMAAA